MFHTKNTLLRPDWSVVARIVVLGLLIVGAAAALAQDSSQQQAAQDLEQRITDYQSGKEPAGPTRAEMLSQIAGLEKEIVSLRTDLAECKKAIE